MKKFTEGLVKHFDILAKIASKLLWLLTSTIKSKYSGHKRFDLNILLGFFLIHFKYFFDKYPEKKKLLDQ